MVLTKKQIRFHKWYLKNRERERERSRKWHHNNPEKVKEIWHKWYLKNAGKMKERTKQWQENNPERSRKLKLQWQVNNPEKVNAKNRKWYLKNVKKLKEKSHQWRLENPEKALAQSITNKAKQKGIIVTHPCEVCGSLKTEAHHYNYGKPLEVYFYCKSHHVKANKLRRVIEQGKLRELVEESFKSVASPS